MKEITFLTQGIMQNGERSKKINQLVQALPVLTKSLFPNVEGRERQRNQQEERKQSKNDIWLLSNRLHDQTPCQTVIQIREDDHVNGRVQERVQAERAPPF